MYQDSATSRKDRALLTAGYFFFFFDVLPLGSLLACETDWSSCTPISLCRTATEWFRSFRRTKIRPATAHKFCGHALGTLIGSMATQSRDAPKIGPLTSIALINGLKAISRR